MTTTLIMTTTVMMTTALIMSTTMMMMIMISLTAKFQGPIVTIVLDATCFKQCTLCLTCVYLCIHL